MRFKQFTALLLVLSLFVPLHVLSEPAIASATLQTAASSGNGSDLSVSGLSLATLSVIGTAGADRVVTFYASQDAVNFSTVACRNMSTLATATSVTTSGTTLFQFQCPIGGMRKLRAAISGGSAGTITVKALVLPHVTF
jgi:hypothetical protein